MSCWIIGGWAEELRGVSPERPHRDIDLLCRAGSFASIDEMLDEHHLSEIEGKRFGHKRAFLFEGVMVELFLVESDGERYWTTFWGQTRHDWPANTFGQLLDLPVASAEALADYRGSHDHLASLRTS